MCTVEVATPHSSMLNMQNMKERFDIPYAQVKPFLTVRSLSFHSKLFSDTKCIIFWEISSYTL